MASSTWVSPEEYERREKYLRAGLREVSLMDPYTWSRPAQGAALMFSLMAVCGRVYDIWNKKPFYYGTEKAKLREEELNEALNRAKEQAERGVVDEQTYGENRIITGQDGFDVKLKDIKNCQLSFVFRPSTVHIQGVHGCKLVFLPVETSILVYDCTKSQIFATAQQLRIHNSHELRLHVGVRAAVIIESCNKIRMAPY
ncbi:tubulin binding cofactor, partial [Teladorsagia circumcincta]